MQNEILNNLTQPLQLEKLYRNRKNEFRQAFLELYPQLKGNLLADAWYERLSYEPDSIQWGKRNDIQLIISIVLISGILAKIPSFSNLNEEFFYPRNIGFIILSALTAFFLWTQEVPPTIKYLITGFTALSLIYINALPVLESDTLILACIHLPILLWGMLGVAFSGSSPLDKNKHLDFLRFNGETLVMTAILAIAAGIMSGVTIGLFELIGIKIEDFYFKNIVIFGFPSIPILGAYLTHNNPNLVNKVSPLVAKIFSPLVLLMLMIYLGAIFFTGKDPYHDREFLLLFNVLLIGVMALIFFSIAESYSKRKNIYGIAVLLLLSIFTIIVNGIALSAILFRISEWGITPNRLAVSGSNLLMLIHLLLVTFHLFKSISGRQPLSIVGKNMVKYIPVYLIWASIVVFVFPLFFE
ncbi:DUF4153 domain-containing protein [Cecembia rubra]|uniref:Uncharacterized protein DUF4153 n=1 Tax=Cecembia rubra TaxID=1485585 RepID=A0A2P8DNE6_9BACT|nr:DUF4153 domain-containing protein [Cecembia rubra]PSK98746.1 uncharacterized protein DUF4153 [Cecembia rubra]